MSGWMLIAVLASAPASAGADEVVELSDVLSSTRELYPMLLAASADIAAADGDRLAAAGAFDPVWRTRAAGVPLGSYPQTRVDSVIEVPTPWWGASFFGGYRLGVGKIQAYYGERETWSAGELRAGAMVPVLRNGPIDRRRATLTRAELARSIAGLSREQQELELVRQAAHRYWDWAGAQERRKILGALLSIARERDTQLARRNLVGDVARFDRQDNLRALRQREALEVQGQRAVEQAALELSLFLRDQTGVPRLPRVAPPLPEPTPPEEVTLEAALARRPDVKRLVEARRSAEVELELQRNQLLPSLDLGAVVSGDLGTPGPQGAAQPVELELTALLEVPILYRAPRGRIDAATAAVSRARLSVELARDRVAVELADAQSALRAALQRLQLARSEVQVAAEVEQGERARFDLGEGSLLFVNLREQATAEARLREVDALIDAHKALATLRAVAVLDAS